MDMSRSKLARQLSRRGFMAVGCGSALAIRQEISGFESNAPSVGFLLIGDTHYLADENDPTVLDPRSRQMTTALARTLQKLPGTPIPIEAGGGTVLVPKGLVHAGDIIDSGDKNSPQHKQMQETEWKAYCNDFGINGMEGAVGYPVYEVHGNHDGPQAEGYAINGIVRRNKERSQQSLGNISPSGLQVSWDWGNVHFVNLGIVVGKQDSDTQKRRYAPADSLDFLVEDLRQHVGTSGRPVILTHHIDLARYSVICNEMDPDNKHREWHPCDIQAFYKAIQPYRIAALLHGHTHVRDVYRWQGSTVKGPNGLNVFNVDNSSHFKSEAQAFMYFEVHDDRLLVRECATKDAWQTYFWTPQIWNVGF